MLPLFVGTCSGWYFRCKVLKQCQCVSCSLVEREFGSHVCVTGNMAPKEFLDKQAAEGDTEAQKPHHYDFRNFMSVGIGMMMLEVSKSHGIAVQ